MSAPLVSYWRVPFPGEGLFIPAQLGSWGCEQGLIAVSEWAKFLLFSRAVPLQGEEQAPGSCAHGAEPSPAQGAAFLGRWQHRRAWMRLAPVFQVESAGHGEAVCCCTRELPSAQLSLAWLLFKFEFPQSTYSYPFFFFSHPPLQIQAVLFEVEQIR